MKKRHKKLLDEYWEDVVKDLVDNHGIKPKRAKKAAEQLRSELASHGVTLLVAHWDPEEYASDIARQIKMNSL